MIATWSVHAQSHEQCMISHVISAWQPRDHCLQLRDQCICSHVISAWAVTWSVYDESCVQFMIDKWSMHDSYVISACSVTWAVHDQPRVQCMIARWSVHDQSRDQGMCSHVISVWSAMCSVHDRQVINAWQLRDHYIAVMWLVHGQWRDQCMISHVFSAWWTPNQCMIAT